MRHFFILLLFVFFAATVFAQAPQGISYQAIAFNAGGSPVANGNVGVKISILDNSATGTVVYAETFTKATNAQGLFNLNIGQGSPVSGAFSSINWATNSKFLKVEIDPAGGTNYTSVGTNQLMSVPYALFADKSNQAGSLSGGGTLAANNGNFLITYDQEASAYNTVTSTWSPTTLSGYIDSSTTSGNNFLITYDAEAKAWSGATGNWTSTTMPGYIEGVYGANGNFLITYDQHARVWNGQTGAWSPTSLGGYIEEAAVSNGNVLVIYDSEAKAWSSQTGNWSSTTLSGYIEKVISSNGNFLIVYDQEAKAWNGQTGAWTSVSLGGYIEKAIGTE